MKDLSTIEHNPMIEEIVDVLCVKTQNTDRPFMRMMVCYFAGKMAGSMRATIETKDRGSIPVNIYALALAVSGSGKTHSVGLLENEFTKGFQERFMKETFPEISEQNLLTIANERLARLPASTEDTIDTVLSKVQGEFKRKGGMAFHFDSGSSPAVKQIREKMVMGDIGALNLQVDEIGKNLMNSAEALTLYLELYDQGLTKQKLTKNSTDNERGAEIEGKTPANCLLFGEPTSLLDGDKNEAEFMAMLQTGYARRCLFAYGHKMRAADELTPAEIYARLINTSNQAAVAKWATHFTLLAAPSKHGWKIYVEDEVAIELLTYRIECERIADALPDQEETRKAEISHRYFKALKLAGALAFVDESSEITMEHLYQAIKMVEESGAAFDQILSREKRHVKLAKFLATVGTEQTQADLLESLPFYKGTASVRNDMMTMAMSWGYKNHIIIKKTFEQAIEFFRGETLKPTSLTGVTLSYSDHVAYRYRSERVPFDRLHELTQATGMHWINHGLVRGDAGDAGEGHRAGENVVAGFDLVVVDIDGAVTVEAARDLLKDYTFLIYTTKSHTPALNRFRIVLPINYRLELDGDDFKEFMANLFSWLPFEIIDDKTQREKKWETFAGDHWYNEGELLNALQFIPKTSKNEEYKASIVKLENLDNLERWFAQRMQSGNRNNQMLRFAMMLADTGALTYAEIEQKVQDFNAKLDNKLPADELRSSVLITVAKKLAAAATP